MITIPVYDLLVLPGVSFYFKKDMFPARKITSEDIGEDVLFLVLKRGKGSKGSGAGRFLSDWSVGKDRIN